MPASALLTSVITVCSTQPTPRSWSSRDSTRWCPVVVCVVVSLLSSAPHGLRPGRLPRYSCVPTRLLSLAMQSVAAEVIHNNTSPSL
jgi:hypothetical protein